MIEPIEGYLLHTWKYAEQGRVLSIFSKKYGILTAFTKKNVRSFKNSHLGLLQPFTALLFHLILRDKSLHTLVYTEPNPHANCPPARKNLAQFYLNELILKTISKQGACHELYDHYDFFMQSTLASSLEKKHHIRVLELNLLKTLGYAIPFPDPILAEAHYQFHPESGFTKIPSGDSAPAWVLDGGRLIKIAQFEFPDLTTLKYAKALFLRQLQWHTSLEVYETYKLSKIWEETMTPCSNGTV